MHLLSVNTLEILALALVTLPADRELISHSYRKQADLRSDAPRARDHLLWFPIHFVEIDLSDVIIPSNDYLVVQFHRVLILL